MPGSTTPNGFPYPISNEPVSDGAAAIQLLAESVDDHVALQKSGTVTTGTLVAGTYSSTAITFTTPFPASGPVPQVVAMANGSTTTEMYAQANSITRSGFTLAYKRTTGTAAMSVHWIATNVGNW